MRPLSGPAAYARAQEKIEDLIRWYARGLRGGHGEMLDGALTACEADAVGFAGELAAVVDDEARLSAPTFAHRIAAEAIARGEPAWRRKRSRAPTEHDA